MSQAPALTIVHHLVDNGYGPWFGAFWSNNTRSTFADETKTIAGKVSDSQAISILSDVDLDAFQAFCKSEENINKYKNVNAAPADIYFSSPLDADSPTNVPAITAILDLAEGVYDQWYASFLEDGPNRSTYLKDDSKTLVAKLSETRAIIMAFDVNIPAYVGYVKSPEFQERVKGFHTGPPQLFVSKPL